MPTWDDRKNLAISNVVTAPSPATSGTTLTVATGHGTRFPAVPFNATVWPRNQFPDPDNAEIVRVTNITGDTFTIVRAQEGTVARSIRANDQIANTLTDKILDDIETAISNIISAGGGGVSVISTELASVDSRVTSVNSRATSIEAHVDTVSAVVAAVETHASTASAAATSADAHANAASAAATSIGVLHSVLSDKVTSISAQLTSLEVHASAASAAATSVLNFVNGVSTRSALSATVSTKGLQSALNALSNRISLNAKAISDMISAGGGGVSVTSNELSAAVAGVGGNRLSLQNVDASAVSAGTPVYVFTSANTFKKADASAVGTELVVGLVQANSIAVSAVGLVQTAGKVTLTTGQWDDVASTSGGLTPGTVYYLHTLPGRITATAPTGTAVVHPIGQALSPTEMQLMLTPWDDSTSVLSALSAAITSIDGRVTSVNTFLGSLSVRTTAGASIKGLQSIFNALSNRISAGGGGTGSVTSTELSAGLAAVSAQAASALADAKSVGSTTASNLLSNINAISTFLAGVSGRSAISAGVSTKGLQSIVNALSNRISINAKAISDMISAGGGGVSVTSNELSAAIANATGGDFLSLQNVAASAVSAGTPVYAFTSANTFKKADASASGTELVVGLVTNGSVAVSAIARVQTGGALSLTSVQWNDVASTTTGLATGTVYYLHTIPGRLTDTPPASPAVVHIVGQAISPNVMQLMLSPWDDGTSALSALSAAITSINNVISAGGGVGSITSNDLSIAVAAISAQAASALSNAISAGSATASNLLSQLNALSNTISNLISAGGGGVSVTSNELSTLLAAVSAQAASALSNAISAGSATASNVLSHIDVLSNSLSAFGGIGAASLSARSIGNVSTKGLQSIINALSNRISAGGGAGSVTSAEVQTASAAATSADAHANTASAAATSVDARVASLSVVFASVSARKVGNVSTKNGLQSVINALSDVISANAAAAVSLVQVASAAATSVDARVASLSAVQASLSVRSVGNVSTHGMQSILNALSNRISATAGGTGSVTSAEVQTASAAATSVLNFVNGVSARSALSATVSTKGLQSVIDALSNRISLNAAALSDAMSVGSTTASNLLSNINALSTLHSALSDKVTSISAQLTSLEVHASTASAAATSVDARLTSVSAAIGNASTAGSLAAISLLSIQINTVSAQVASISAQLGTLQLLKVATGNQTIAGTAFTTVSGLTVSCAANGTYAIDGVIVYTLSVLTGVAFGFSYNTTGNNQISVGGMEFKTYTSINVASSPAGATLFTSTMQQTGFGGAGAGVMSTATTAMVSILGGASATQYVLFVQGLVNGTSAFNMNLQAKVSAAGNGVQIMQGSYIRAVRTV